MCDVRTEGAGVKIDADLGVSGRAAGLCAVVANRKRDLSRFKYTFSVSKGWMPHVGDGAGCKWRRNAGRDDVKVVRQPIGGAYTVYEMLFTRLEKS